MGTYTKSGAIISVLLAILTILPTEVLAADLTREAYEEAKRAYEKIEGPFTEVKGKIDATYEFLERFNSAMYTWRNAVTRETQNRGIEEIDKLADDHIEAAIDKLFDKAKDAFGLPDEISIPQSMKEKAVEKLRERFKGHVPPRVANRLGYMYTLSALDRRLRDNYIYENLRYIKQGFDKGSTLLKNFNNATKFIDTFSPYGVESSPVGRLKKVKDFLGIIGDIAKPIPLMGEIIDGYSRATDGFMTALNDLDQKLRDARQGSLCGQGGVDRDIQEAFQKAHPHEDCLTYFALSSAQYPHLAPIRAWEGGQPSKVYLWYNGEGAMLSGPNFDIQYRLYAVLKESYSYSGIVDHERFMNRAKAAQNSNFSALIKQFEGYYQKFVKDYYFKEALDFDGLYKNGVYYSLQGRRLEYQLGGSEDEFVALCFWHSVFLNNIKSIYEKYQKAIVIDGSIKPSMPNAVISKIEVLIDGVPPKELRCADKCTFRHLVLSDRYTINVVADGYQPIKKTFQREKYPTLNLEMLALKIESDKQSVMIGEKVWLRATVPGRDTSRDRFYWYAKRRPFGGSGDRVQYMPTEPGIHQISVTLIDEGGRPVLEGSYLLNVTEPIGLFILGPAETQTGVETTFVADLRGGQQGQVKYGYSWLVNGNKFGSNEGSIRIKFDKVGSHNIKVTAWQWLTEQRQWQKIGEASHNINVRQMQPTPLPNTPRPTPSPTPKLTPSPTPKPTPSPTPTPKIRQFNELNKDEQQKVLDCLCRCNSTATSSVAVYYDTKPDGASPSCMDLKNGPCVNKGFGCWRHVPVNTGGCAERCYKNANVQGVPSSLMNIK